MTFVLVKLICRPLLWQNASLVAQTVKKLPVMQETRVQLLSQEDSLEKEIAAHSRILAWKNPMDRDAWRVHTESGT